MKIKLEAQPPFLRDESVARLSGRFGFIIHCCKKAATFGFSLVEVVLAMAIAALGILTVMGLLPMSVNNVTQAGKSTTISRIYAQMLSELQSVDWGTYSTGYPGWSKLNTMQSPAPSSRRYFDNEGTMLTESESGTFNQVYISEFFFPPQSVQMTGVAGSSGSADLRRDMRNVLIRIAQSSSAEYVFSDEVPHESRSFTITRPY